MHDDDSDLFDMVKALEMIVPFSGTENEDIDVWIQDLEYMGKMACWRDSELYRITLLSLQDEAQIWASQVVGGNVAKLNFSKLKDLLRERFSVPESHDFRLPKFCIMHGRGYHISRGCRELTCFLMIEKLRLKRKDRKDRRIKSDKKDKR